MKPQLVMFTKSPRIGRVKSRLAAGIGKVAAWQFYFRNLRRVSGPLARDPRWDFSIAISPDETFPQWGGLWNYPTIKQGNGDLGERMQRVMNTRPPGPLIIIGSDIPDIRPEHINRAFKALGNHDGVIGPAGDGGYWLVGLRRSPRIPQIFKTVRWSTKHALADTLTNFTTQSRIAFTETLNDVDDAECFMKYNN